MKSLLRQINLDNASLSLFRFGHLNLYVKYIIAEIIHTILHWRWARLRLVRVVSRRH